MTAMRLLPNTRYFAGANLPFYVSHGMVDGWLLAHGFTVIVWHARSERLPWDVNPKNDNAYREDWDEWVSAIYQGPAASIELPSQPSWVVALPPAVGHAPASSVAAQIAAANAERWAAAQAAAEALARTTSTAVSQTGKPRAAPASQTSGPALAAVGLLALVVAAGIWVGTRKKC